jgi:hypothetical protein
VIRTGAPEGTRTVAATHVLPSFPQGKSFVAGSNALTTTVLAERSRRSTDVW